MKKSTPVPPLINAFLIVLFSFAAMPAGFGQGRTAAKKSENAAYSVEWLSVSEHKLSVTATLPVNGKALLMDSTRPGNIPKVGDNGWPELVRDLKIQDESGRPLGIKRAGDAGWELAESKSGSIKVTYTVDYSLLEENKFPAPREAGFSNAENFVVVGRSLFVSTESVRHATVDFRIPTGWFPVMPWEKSRNSKHGFDISAANELTENMLVFTRIRPEETVVGKFRFSVTALGEWRNVRSEINEILRKAVPIYARFVGNDEAINYSIILLPMFDDDWAGESYRGSFAMNAKEKPSVASRNVWGQMIAHEIFHYWNGWRLAGREYAGSQWFQEGFTQYAADLAVVASGLVSEDVFKKRIGEHVVNYRKLTTTLENPGTHKGRPLYSGGALVALCWDIKIRNATGGKRDITDFFRNLWLGTRAAGHQYDWADIKKALNATAALDWEAFYANFIKGQKKLPLEETLALAGLELRETEAGVSVLSDSNKTNANTAKLWRNLIAARK